MSFHTIQLKHRVFEMLPIAKKEFLDHHNDWEVEHISNNKIIYEALKYYIRTGKYKEEVKWKKLLK